MASFPCFSALTDADRTAMQSISFGRGFGVATTPTVRTPAPESVAPRDRSRVPAMARPVVPVAPRGMVALSTAAFTGRLSAVVLPRLRSAVVHSDGISVTVPARLEPRHPLGSYLDSLTRDQRRNLKRRMRRTALRKFKRVRDRRSIASTSTPAELRPADVQSVPVSSHLLSGSRFHPLSTAPEEEDAVRIARASPRPLDYDASLPSPSRVAYQRHRHLRLLYQRLADQSGQSLSRFLRSAKVAIVDESRRDLLRRDDTDAIPLTTVPRRERKRFYRQPAISTMTDAYYSVPRIPGAPSSSHAPTQAITLTGPDLQGVAPPRRKRPRRKARRDTVVREVPPPAPQPRWVRVSRDVLDSGMVEDPSPRDVLSAPPVDGGIVSTSAHSSFPSREEKVLHPELTTSAPPLS